MTIEREDLDAAIEAGVVTSAQAEALRAFVAQRNQSTAALLGSEDEHFRFMRGFNDFFFAIGILLLGFGICFFAGRNWMFNLGAVAIIWALSLGLVGRMRLVLPGILLSMFFILFVYLAVPVDLATMFMPARFVNTQINNFFLDTYLRTTLPGAVLVRAPIAALAAGLYYWRFRLPFTLLPIAVAIVMTVSAAAGIALGPQTSFARSLIPLCCGLGVFAAAMAFDLSDRDRMTRRSDCAFWLHLVAAPLIVHSLISVLPPNMAALANGSNDMAMIGILMVVFALAVVAIVIDRRAMLVSALLYIGFVIAYAIRMTGVGGPNNGGFVIFATLILLGAFVIALGVGWQPLRKFLMGHISPALAARLPRVPGSASR